MKCKICGAEFPATLAGHYVSRDSTEVGLVAALKSSDEPALYDTFDCPNCGCQVLAQTRKRVHREYDLEEAEDDEDATETEEDE